MQELDDLDGSKHGDGTEESPMIHLLKGYLSDPHRMASYTTAFHDDGLEATYRVICKVEDKVSANVIDEVLRKLDVSSNSLTDYSFFK